MGRAGVAVVIASVGLALAGCTDRAPTSQAASGQTNGSGPPPPSIPSATIAYDGPLHVTASKATHPRAGAAGNVVDCDVWGGGGLDDDAVYAGGATGDSAELGLQFGFSEGLFLTIAQDELRTAKREPDRVLFVVTVAGRIKEAVIVHDGPATDGAGGPGWHVESWASCDISELPRSYTDVHGLQIWHDRAGHVVPVKELRVERGPEHCNWQSMTFLETAGSTFVRNPQPDLGDYFAVEYADHAQLPTDAIDTGYQHDADRLWLAADNSVAYVGTPDDVEVWPRTVRSLGCG